MKVCDTLVRVCEQGMSNFVVRALLNMLTCVEMQQKISFHWGFLVKASCPRNTAGPILISPGSIDFPG